VNFVPHVPDQVVTALTYRHMPSWFAVACYFDWRKHYAAEQLEREGIGRQRADGSVLTEQGWLLPRSEVNPRLIDMGDHPVVGDPEQEAVDAQVDQARADHEAAVLHEDMAIFSMQWNAVITQTQKTRRALLAVRGLSEEREAFMVRWHGDHGPH
jgi:hypothetical protein